MSFRPFLLLVFLCVLALLYPHPASAQVRRCVTPNGQAIFTDRRCDEVGATESVPREQAAAGDHAHRTGGCARTVQDLVFELTSAIDAHDANRLAGVYHWPGLSSDTGYQVWERLEAIANRPLVDIVPVMPTSRPPPEPLGDGSAEADPAEGVASRPPQTSNEAVDPELYPQTTVRRNPVALRVEQTLANSATPSRTIFGLTHYFGCWWVRF